MYIYKIVNRINNKIYIGKTNNLKRRKREHFNKNNIKNEPNKALYMAMYKYGFENFYMELIEECEDSEWEEREQYWIEKLNTLIPGGYNMIDGGTEPPHHTGEQCKASKLKDIEVKEIQKILLTKNYREISNKEIAEQFNISVDQITRINSGLRGYDDKLKYPLRKHSMEDYVDEIIELLYSWNYTCQEIADMYNVSKSCIKEINRGVNHHKENIIYPIKPPNAVSGINKKTYKIALQLLKDNIPYKKITEKTGLGYTALKSLEKGKYKEYLE